MSVFVLGKIEKYNILEYSMDIVKLVFYINIEAQPISKTEKH